MGEGSNRGLDYGGCVDPEDCRAGLAGVVPTVPHLAFKIEAVSGAQPEHLIGQGDVELSADEIQEFLAVVRVVFGAALAWVDVKEVGFHDDLSPGEKLHLNAVSARQSVVP